MTVRKYNALFRVWEDEQFRRDFRTAKVQLDLRNAWYVGESHPDAWQLSEVLPSRQAHGDGIISEGNSPEAEAWFKAFKIKCAIAVANKKWDGPDYFPLPS